MIQSLISPRFLRQFNDLVLKPLSLAPNRVAFWMMVLSGPCESTLTELAGTKLFPEISTTYGLDGHPKLVEISNHKIQNPWTHVLGGEQVDITSSGSSCG